MTMKGEHDVVLRRSGRTVTRSRHLYRFIEYDEESKPCMRSRSKNSAPRTNGNGRSSHSSQQDGNQPRLARRSRTSIEEEDTYHEDASHASPTSSGGSSLHTSSPDSPPSPVVADT